MCYSGIFCKEKLDANHLGIKGFINCQLNAIHDRLNEISTVRTRRMNSRYRLNVDCMNSLFFGEDRRASSRKNSAKKKNVSCNSLLSRHGALTSIFFYPLIFITGATDFAERKACSL